MMSSIFCRPRVFNAVLIWRRSGHYRRSFHAEGDAWCCGGCCAHYSHEHIRRLCFGSCGSSSGAGQVKQLVFQTKVLCRVQEPRSAGAEAAAAETSHAPAFNTRYNVSTVLDHTEATKVPELTLDAYERCKSMVALFCNGCCWRTFRSHAYDIGVASGCLSILDHSHTADVFKCMVSLAQL